MTDPSLPPWIEHVTFDDAGLVPAIAQDAQSGRVLMMAWMNREALWETVRSMQAVFYSRSRAGLWRKGETSGQVQKVKEIRLDCDGDCLLLKVEQVGEAACHTGRESCFFNQLLHTEPGDSALADQARWVVVDPVLIDPKVLYRKSGS